MLEILYLSGAVFLFGCLYAILWDKCIEMQRAKTHEYWKNQCDREKALAETQKMKTEVQKAKGEEYRKRNWDLNCEVGKLKKELEELKNAKKKS